MASDANLDEMIFSALKSNRRSRAILLAYRKNGGPIADAWHLINSLVDQSNYDEPDQDPSFLCVQQYLDGRSPWHETKPFLLAAAISVLLGAWLLSYKLPIFITGLHSYSWNVAHGTIKNVHCYSEGRWSQQRKIVNHYMDYQYEYTVNNFTHRKTVRRCEYYPALGEESHKRGESIRVLYNPDWHEQSIHRRWMYQRCLGVVLGLIIATPGLGIFAYFAFEEWNLHRLRKHDPLIDTFNHPSLS